MRKLLLLSILSCVILLASNATMKAETVITEQSLETQGFSPYLSRIAILQVKKQERIPYEKPDRVDTAFRHIFVWGEWLDPTQEFGYYDLSVRD